MTAEFIYEKAPFPSCHASTIVEAEPGRFLAAWFGGSREGADDVAIWLSRYDGRWSEPEKIADEPGKPCWNPVLFRRRKSGEIQLYYKAGPSPDTWSGFVRTSADGGHTFGVSRILPAGLLGPIKNKPLELDDGTILAPTSVESYRAWACWVERSGDGGKTWTKHGPIFHPEHAEGIIQPSILRRTDGSLFMLARSTRRIGQICRSTSLDAGCTWSPAEAIKDLPNPNSGIDAVTMADGRHALVYNPTHIGRTPLVLALSADDGATWKTIHVLEDAAGEYSYPAVIQAADGSLHMTYTWKRQKVRHVWFSLDDLVP
ncbi:MAG TPA: sialidase family protein [Pirellulales bacterium]|nr:sialidase family protein [Pirellulales bacterium]